MISHKYKCIFIHIPRTGGTFIEKIIQGKDQWNVNSGEKHFIASQARREYLEYWDEYFKFSFVRDPWARTISSLKFPKYFKLSFDSHNVLSMKKYKEFYGHPICLEHDWRYSRREDLLRESHLPGSIYLNMLDEKLDFIGKYENMSEDLKYVLSKIGINKSFKILTPKNSYEKYYTPTLREEVRLLYQKDIEKFQYEFGQGALVSKY